MNLVDVAEHRARAEFKKQHAALAQEGCAPANLREAEADFVGGFLCCLAVLQECKIVTNNDILVAMIYERRPS